MAKNPFSSPSGGSLPGKTVEFYEWAKSEWERQLAAMSEPEREKALARKASIARRMQSETGLPVD